MKLKRSLALALAGVSMITISGAVSETYAFFNLFNSAQAQTKEIAGETVIVSVSDAAGEMIDVEFPKNPERIVALNLQTVDFLDALGMGDKIVGMIKESTIPEHLQKYVDNKDIVNVGGMKDVDMEAVMSLQPDVIFSSDRTKSKYKEFSMIAPTMSAYVDYTGNFMDGYKNLAKQHSAIFGVEDELDEILAEYDARIARIAEFAQDKTALLGIFAGGLNTLGNDGRCSIIVDEMGFNNLAGGEDVNHGNVSSYEAWLKFDPDYMFVLDKDNAVGTEAVAAKEQMEKNNPIIAETQAFKNGKIIYLEPSDVWYVADGGITSLDLMITNIEKGLGLPEYSAEVKEVADKTIETVTVSVSDATGNMIDVEFPKNPEKVVVLNLQTLDFLDAMGLGDSIVGLIKDTIVPEHLQKYVDDESIANVGGMKSVNVEAVKALEPDIIFSSDRTKKNYDIYSAIAPTMSAFVEYDGNFMDGFKTLADNHATIFGVEDKLDEILNDYDARIAKIAEFSMGETALIGMFVGGNLNTLGSNSRCSVIVDEMGFTNLKNEAVDYGEMTKYEQCLVLDPNFIFILDKDMAVGTEGAVIGKEVIEANALIKQTQAYKNGNIIYLESGAQWYLADGGITSLDQMISDIEKGLGLK